MHQRDTKAIVGCRYCESGRTGRRVGFRGISWREAPLNQSRDGRFGLLPLGRTTEGVGPGPRIGAFYQPRFHIERESAKYLIEIPTNYSHIY